VTALPLPSSRGGDRFPGFDVLTQRDHWDAATRSVIESRLGLLPEMRFFDLVEEACATALFDQLLDQRGDPKVPVTRMVDSRLAEKETDGWHYESMPADADAWRRSLAALDDDAKAAGDTSFAECSWDEQHRLLTAIQRTEDQLWHGMAASSVWSLWTRYACTAFYAHPLAWNEIGFAGPAYPRGYKNLGIDKREPFEVRDAHPSHDPTRTSDGR
jgi:hypothetical protein